MMMPLCAISPGEEGGAGPGAERGAAAGRLASILVPSPSVWAKMEAPWGSAGQCWWSGEWGSNTGASLSGCHGCADGGVGHAGVWPGGGARPLPQTQDRPLPQGDEQCH